MVDGIGTLDGGFQDGLPKTQIFTGLEELVAFVKASRTVETPPPDDVEEAKKHEAKAAAEMTWYMPTTTPYPYQLASSGVLTAPRGYLWRSIAGVLTLVPSFEPGPVKRVSLLRRNEQSQYEQVGIIELYRLPAQKLDDYRCSGTNLTFEQVKDMSTALTQNRVKGQIGDYEWWED